MSEGMMSYEVFKEKVVEKIKDYLPDSMKDAKVSVRKVVKNNCELDGITIMKEDTGVAPTMYIDMLYKAYTISGDFEDVMTTFADSYMESLNNAPKLNLMNVVTSSEFIKSHVIMCLVNVERNEKLLKNHVYVKYLDLAIIFRVIVDKYDDDIASYLVSNELAEEAGLSEDDLLSFARKNTYELFPVNYKTLTNAIKEIDSTAKVEDTPDNPMYMASNNIRINGAVAMLNGDLLKKFSEYIADDFYILPSSVHEIILLPVGSHNDISELREHVKEVNHFIDPQDFLSNLVYKYIRETESVVIA